MEIYLPIAEMSVQWLVVLGMGFGVGFLSGMFGIGGGFLLTPLLIFYGIPPGVAVGTTAGQVSGVTFSGVLTHWKRRSAENSQTPVAVPMRPATIITAPILKSTVRRFQCVSTPENVTPETWLAVVATATPGGMP